MHEYFFILSILIPGSLLHIIPAQIYQQQVLYKSNVPKPRLSEAEYNHYDIREPDGPGTYAFGYDVEDAKTGNTQFREEERHPNGTVTGSYGYVEPDGNLHVVHYVADERGYRVRIENSRDMKPIAAPKISNFKSQSTAKYNPVNNYYRANGPVIVSNQLPTAVDPYGQRNYVRPVIVPANELSPPIVVPLRNYNNHFTTDQFYDNVPIASDQQFGDQILPQNGLFYNTYYANSLK